MAKSRDITTLDARISAFVRETYGPRGTIRLHRAALGWDILRAPLNLLLAPVFLATRIFGLLARLGKRERLATWLMSRDILIETAVAGVVRQRIEGFLAGLDADGVTAASDPKHRERLIGDYAGVRSAVAEITTMLVLVTIGLVVFRTATPGVVSLAAPMAAMRAQIQAIENFPLGSFIGRAWYGVFPVHLSPLEVVGTALVLAIAASIVTTFAGLIADPIQVAIGSHKRRLKRLIAKLERAEAGEGLEREHLLARLGDMSDIVLTLWRSLR